MFLFLPFAWVIRFLWSVHAYQLNIRPHQESGKVFLRDVCRDGVCSILIDHFMLQIIHF